MISFYDSGIGGKTILSKVLEIQPNLDIQYFADLQFMPLGSKSKIEIINRLKVICNFLFKNSDLIVLACNTASVNCIWELQNNWLPLHFPKKQILGISKPIVEIFEQSNTDKMNKISILCTPATHQSGFYKYEIEKLGFKNVESIPCLDLAFAIENRNQQAIESSLYNISQENCDILLLACTHYPIVKKQIQNYFPKAKILDPSYFIANRLFWYLHKHPEYRQGISGQKIFYDSKDMCFIIDNSLNFH